MRRPKFACNVSRVMVLTDNRQLYGVLRGLHSVSRLPSRLGC